MSANRATQAELVKRREEIRGLIASGVKQGIIKEEMAKKWKTSTRAISEDIRLIGKEWQEQDLEESKTMKNKYMERLEHMFSEAMAEDKIKLALEIQKEIHKMAGLYAEKDKEDAQMPKFINISKRSELKVVGDDDK